MDTLSYKTISANKETANKEWFVVDAEGQILGRMASKIAKVLRGKYKTNFTPHADCGDYVIVINAGKIVMTGRNSGATSEEYGNYVMETVENSNIDCLWQNYVEA